MEFYKIEKVNEKIKAIRSLTGEIMYFIEGEKEAVLIDTCLGIGHLRKLIQTCTDKPLTVLLTHGHLDHSLGAPEFKNVYMNQKDKTLYAAQSPLEERKGYIKAGLGSLYEDLKEEDYVMPQPEKEFLDLEDGMTFDLGGLHIDVYRLPGHTQGSMVFLIREEKILILGDACNDSTFLFDDICLTVEEYRDELIRLKNMLTGKFIKVFISHHRMEVQKEILSNMISVCDEIMEGRADDLPFEFMGKKAWIAKQCNERFERTDGKSGNLIYRKDRIWRQEN